MTGAVGLGLLRPPGDDHRLRRLVSLLLCLFREIEHRQRLFNAGPYIAAAQPERGVTVDGDSDHLLIVIDRPSSPMT